MAPEVAKTLARLGQRELFVGDDDLVFVGTTGGYLDGSALSKRFRASLVRAGLRRLRFHDLRHTFGTRVIAKADIRRVQEWMGHANVQTTMQYLHLPLARRTRLSSRRHLRRDRSAPGLRGEQFLARRARHDAQSNKCPAAPGMPRAGTEGHLPCSHRTVYLVRAAGHAHVAAREALLDVARAALAFAVSHVACLERSPWFNFEADADRASSA
jgi:hypothetical protein